MRSQELKKKNPAAALMKAFFFAGLGLIVCLGAMEMITRVVYSLKLDYQIEMCRYAAIIKTKAQDNRLSHQHKPGAKAKLMGVPVEINSHGFRDKEYAAEKPTDTYRILFLGDSLTFGWGARAEDRFSELLETKLNAKLREEGVAKKVQIINTGVGNYNTVQEVSFFEEQGFSWKPDLVLQNFFINDGEPTPQKRASFLLKYSYFAMWFWGRLDTLKRMSGKGLGYQEYYARLYQEDQPGWREAKAAMRRMGEFAKAGNFKWQAALLPELHSVGKQYAFQEIHNRVAKAFKEAGSAQVFDLAGRFENETPQNLWVSPDDAHPNARAHAIIAEGLYEELLKQGILEDVKSSA